MSFHKLFSPNLKAKHKRRGFFNNMQPHHCLLSVILCFILSLSSSSALEHSVHLSQNGVRGTVNFHQEDGGTGPVHIRVDLSATTSDFEGEYTWGIYQFPIDYSVQDYCHSRMVGRRPLIDLSEKVGQLTLTSGAQQPQTFVSEEMSLVGKDGIWGRSLILEGPSKARICGTVSPVDSSLLKIGEARFTSPIAGTIWFTSLSKGDSVEIKILTNLFHVQSGKSTNHDWRVFISDILDTASDLQGSNCDFLQSVYDADDQGGGPECSEEHPENCREGDLTGKFGQVRVGKRESMFTKGYHTDLHLELPELEGRRSLFVVVYDEDHEDSFLACARIRDIKPRVGKATFMHDGIEGQVRFSQASPFLPVRTDIDLSGLKKGAGGFHVHDFPVPPKMDGDDNACSRTAGHFNPFKVDSSSSPVIGTGSFDKYEVGDLSGKYGSLKDQEQVRGKFYDPNLSLFGKYSILERSVVIHRSPVPKRWVCANIETNGQIITAVAQFTYPIAGRIIFRQEMDNPFADTSVLVESLLYSDGSKNDTRDHKWHVHVEEPGKDYFNWTGRCLSAGPHYNPYKVSMEGNLYNDCVNDHKPLRCELGDLFNKHGGVNVAGKKKDIKASTKLFTDTNLPLSGPNSIIGHSIVIHDDFAPKHRGNRMACTVIKRQYRHKAVVKEWFGNGVQPAPVSGRLEFIQDTERSMTHTLVDLKGMKGEANAYHVHQIPVQDHLEFPCTGDAVGGHFNPYKWDASESPRPSTGTPDQYEIGDLSGKYGLLAGESKMQGIYNDTNLPLFGYDSIVGRSIVVHKKFKGQRWACASIGWGFDPDEAKEVRAIASFHHPKGFAWGYIRLRQVVYRDGSTTDTSMEVRLKYPGKTNKDTTYDHHWSVFVNPVSHDAAVEFHNARCSAAGYRWNPTHIQLADPNDHGFYGEQCGPDQPLRCMVGDLSGRHGKLTVGGKAYVVNDPNLPLTGDWFQSAIGKSIVINEPNGAPERMACANIEEEKEIVKFATIESKPSFNLASFIEEVQGIMGVPEWFVFIDTRKTKTLFGGKCTQIQLHFAGPNANKLEQDFNRLMRTGRLDRPSLTIPGYVPPPGQRKSKLGYRECGQERVGKNSNGNRNDDFYSSLSGGGAKNAVAHLAVVLAVLAAAALLQ